MAVDELEGAAVVDGRILVRLNASTSRRARAVQPVRWVETTGARTLR